MNWSVSTDEFDAARAQHAIVDEWLRDRGREHLRADRLAYPSSHRTPCGTLDLADEHAERSCDMVEGFEIGLAHAVAFGYPLLDRRASREGLERARSTLLSLMDDAEHRPGTFVERLLSIPGFVELPRATMRRPTACFT